MTIPEFLLSLPDDPKRALGEIEGVLAFAGDLTPADRQALVTKRAEMMRRRK